MYVVCMLRTIIGLKFIVIIIINFLQDQKLRSRCRRRRRQRGHSNTPYYNILYTYISTYIHIYIHTKHGN